nr:LPXTG cell wall anchor domain-containing protein [Actinomycetales bacterium]
MSCGYVYISMTSRVKPYTYQMEYRMVDTAGRPYGEARTLPNEGLWFDEDENGGSVRIGAYIGGLEEAYIQFAGPDDLQWKSPGRSITIKTDCQTVNYCDPSQRPNGLSIAEWLATAPGDSKIKCMTVGEPVITCGAIDIPFASSVVGLDYQIEYWELDADGKAVGRAKIMPEGGLTFAEGHNNGSVTIQAYVGGPEQDYVGASGVGTFRYPGEQFTVKTTCETTPPTEPPTEKPTEPPTEPATEPATEKPTEKPTEGTGTPSEKPTEKPTEGTGTPTEKPSDKPTSGAATPSVKPSAGAKLPSTGSDTAPLAASALLMLGLGAVAVAARARRTAQ